MSIEEAIHAYWNHKILIGEFSKKENKKINSFKFHSKNNLINGIFQSIKTYGGLRQSNKSYLNLNLYQNCLTSDNWLIFLVLLSNSFLHKNPIILLNSSKPILYKNWIQNRKRLKFYHYMKNINGLKMELVKTKLHKLTKNKSDNSLLQKRRYFIWIRKSRNSTMSKKIKISKTLFLLISLIKTWKRIFKNPWKLKNNNKLYYLSLVIKYLLDQALLTNWVFFLNKVILNIPQWFNTLEKS